MASRVVQSMVFEYTCDECKKSLRGESTPERWASVQVESFAGLDGRRARHLDLCSDCITLEKYAWVRE